MSMFVVSMVIGGFAGWLIGQGPAATEPQESAVQVLKGDRLGQCRRELEELENVVQELSQAAASRVEPSRIIQALSASTPESVSVSSVQMQAGHVEVIGRAMMDGDVRSFVSRLDAEEIVKSVTIVSSLSGADTTDTGILFRLHVSLDVNPAS